jgi:uncharacterized protein YggE
VTISGIDAKATKVSPLLDSLVTIANININSVTFDIYDKKPLEAKARAAAFNDAKSKAADYAEFAGLRLGPVIKIEDSVMPVNRPQPLDMVPMMRVSSMGPTSISVGTLDVSYSSVVTFRVN